MSSPDRPPGKIYIIAAIVIPEEPIGATRAAAGTTTGVEDPGWEARHAARRAARNERRGNGAMIFGLLLVLVGAWFLIDRYVNIDSALIFPAVLMIIGGALVIGALARSGGRGPS